MSDDTLMRHFHAYRAARDRLQTIVDEAFGPFEEMQIDGLLDLLEKHYHAERIEMANREATARRWAARWKALARRYRDAATSATWTASLREERDAARNIAHLNGYECACAIEERDAARAELAALREAVERWNDSGPHNAAEADAAVVALRALAEKGE